MLFIDARNYYTVVDRTLNEWSDWQLKNLNAIVWLYRGELKTYQSLLSEYDAALQTHSKQIGQEIDGGRNYAQVLETFRQFRISRQEQAKAEADEAARKDKKKVQAAWDAHLSEIDQAITAAKEAMWLYEKFGEGEYQDIPGLCKIASRQEIEDKGYSLTPGAYVGVTDQEDDGVDFEERMKEIHAELLSLQQESNRLMETISRNMEEMGL